MSQNAHSLLLFFDDEQRHKICLLMFLKLDKGEDTEAEAYGAKLGVDVSAQWHDVWFNQAVSAQPDYIRVDYETGTSEDLPLDVLRQLFDSGLKAAVLHTFYDQVGEFSTHHFLDNALVSSETLFRAHPALQGIVSRQLALEDGEDYSVDTDEPVSIEKLMEREKRHEEQGREMLEGLLAIGKLSRETGQSPEAVLKSVLILRALGKGLLQGLGFTVVTVLLFKGLWLWIGLGVLLTVLLPLIYMLGVVKEFSDEGEEDDADGN